MYNIVVTHGHNADEESIIPKLDSVFKITSSRATTYFGAITKPANSTVSNSKLGIPDRNGADSCAHQSSGHRSHNRFFASTELGSVTDTDGQDNKKQTGRKLYRSTRF
ncbi:hypothetical protein KIW84_013011 [Lathyrus oleraceus]|uniref:Uncharacterized protein n=1 Tax=Pisum sativum TaxID=3888 RepID=A0A9D5GXF3_PEA|nr:hypothetical protein KIW84_013011 [Pisum sativum]